jgi:hypothetical protein
VMDHVWARADATPGVHAPGVQLHNIAVSRPLGVQRRSTRYSPFQPVKENRNAVIYLHQTAFRPRAPDAG